MFLLDTNIISELRKPRPHGALVEWIRRQRSQDLFISAVTCGEIQAGIERTRNQNREKAEELEAWLDGMPSKAFL